MACTYIQESDRPGNTPVVLQILKFSYATSSGERTSPLAWTHLSGGENLVAIFDTIRVREDNSKWTKERRILRVLRGDENLEELELDSLSKGATSACSTTYLQTQNTQSIKPPVAIIVKSPCLAIRYPTRANQVRRFQVKFASEADYYKAISILSEAGCPITESNVGLGVQSNSRRPTTSGSTTSINARVIPPTPESHCSVPDVQNIRPLSSTVVETRPSSMGSSVTLSNTTAGYSNPATVTSSVHPLPHPAIQDPKPRPSTAPIADVETLSQILPPKRELPFIKTSQRRAGAERPIPQQQTPLVPSTHLAPSASTSKPDMMTSLVHSSAPIETTAINPGSQTRMQTNPNINNKSLLPSPDLSPNKVACVLSNISETGVEQQPQQQPQSQHQAQTVPTPQRAGDSISSGDLSSYLSSPAPERSALVESWVCQQLESDGFLALCQDMEGVWRRMAFGL